jgi:uncharacterized RmlC-like cupin family protein
MAASPPGSVPSCVVVRGRSSPSYEGRQGLSYFDGVSAQSSGAEGLCLSLLRIPPGGRASAHLHAGHESAAYLISGHVEVLHGERLGERFEMDPGDFTYIPAGAPHIVRNLSTREPALGIVARTDPNEQESVVLLPELESAAEEFAGHR